MPNITQLRLLRVAEAKSAVIKNWREGIDLRDQSGVTIEEIQQRVTVARWRFARDLLTQATAMLENDPPMCRNAVSRYYYAMYHAMRAVVYLANDGDDHEEHRVLPSKTPPDFPNADIWQNALKSAREHRNHADYEPYPRRDARFRRVAESLRAEAQQLISLSRVYLRAKGCVTI